MLSLPQALPLPIPRLTRAVEARWHQVRAHPLLNPVAFEELWRERAGHAVDSVHRPHLLAALEWLERAQDATGAGGFARGYSLAWSPYFKSRGWQPAYPETTGYIIPTLYEAARRLNRPDRVGSGGSGPAARRTGVHSGRGPQPPRRHPAAARRRLVAGLLPHRPDAPVATYHRLRHPRSARGWARAGGCAARRPRRPRRRAD